MTLLDGHPYRGIDLLCGGLPCPPFSVAGRQLGAADERNLFPAFVRLVDESRPRAIMIENVRGFLDPRFAIFRNDLEHKLQRLGYRIQFRLLQAAAFGVPQLRPRVIIVGFNETDGAAFRWPDPHLGPTPTVGSTLRDLMASRGWPEAETWAARAQGIAPTLVGGSRKHGGPDLGPTRARKAWAALGVDGRGVVDDPPSTDHAGMPRLTVRMAARLQGFPDEWVFAGRRTAAYRQVGNAFPPPVAHAVAEQIKRVLETKAIRAVA
jgi:DNA (cytosine-5)-methyltransferase 1